MGAAEKKSEVAGTCLVVMTEAQLRELIGDAVREAIGASDTRAIEYLTIDQVAELLQTSTRSVRNWVRDNGLPALRAGAEYRFQRTAIVRWLEERAVTPGVHVSKTIERLKRAK